MVLSTVVGRETLHSLPSLVAEINDHEVLRSVLDVATEIARRSAKHSAEFLNASGSVSRELKSFQRPERNVSSSSARRRFCGARRRHCRRCMDHHSRSARRTLSRRRNTSAQARQRVSRTRRRRGASISSPAARFCAARQRSSTNGSNCCGSSPRMAMRVWLLRSQQSGLHSTAQR